MPDLIAISQGFSALRSATEIIKTIAGLRDSAQLLENTVELNQKILTAQTALANAQKEQTALVQTIRRLEEEIARSKTWETEKQRYELKAVGDAGFTYALKADAQGTEPPHQICAACYQSGKKSILQRVPSNSARATLGMSNTLRCPECKSEVVG